MLQEFFSHKVQLDQPFLPLKVIAFLSAAIDLSLFWKTFLCKKKDILTKCAALAFFATLLSNLNIKGAKVWSTGAQDGEGTAEEEKDRGGQAWR